MLLVLLNWAYIGITAFLAGFAVLAPFGRKISEKETGYVCRTGTGVLMAGLAFITVYAQVFSLFSGVGLWANVLLLLACAVCAVLLRRQLAAFILGKWRESSPGGRLFLAVLVLLMAYGTSRGYMHVDTGLYHAQAIRWIEEYGVVPGLGNLHSRFAYNSAAFPLCAIYGMRWMAGGSWTESMHAVQGFLALLVGIQCCGLGRLAKRKRVLVSDFVRVGAIYYLTVLYREMVSPASDYFAMLLLFLYPDCLAGSAGAQGSFRDALCTAQSASGIYHNSEAVGSGYAAACAEAGGYASEGKALEGDRPVYRAWRADSPPVADTRSADIGMAVLSVYIPGSFSGGLEN